MPTVKLSELKGCPTVEFRNDPEKGCHFLLVQEGNVLEDTIVELENGSKFLLAPTTETHDDPLMVFLARMCDSGKYLEYNDGDFFLIGSSYLGFDQAWLPHRTRLLDP